MEAIGLVLLGLLLLVVAPFRYYHDSWKSPWQVAGAGLLCMALGALAFALERWW